MSNRRQARSGEEKIFRGENKDLCENLRRQHGKKRLGEHHITTQAKSKTQGKKLSFLQGKTSVRQTRDDGEKSTAKISDRV